MKTKIAMLAPFLSAAVLSAFAALAAVPQPAAAQDAASTAEYRIGPKDLLEISVFGEEDMKNLVVRVSEDGKITFPLLREVEVNGLTKGEVERKITLLLAEKYLQNPQVTVFIKEYLSKRVSVLGAVERPGPFELLGRQTLLQLISQSGGLTRDAGSEIIVIRQLADGTSTSLRISIDDLFFKGDPNLNIPLEPGDIVNVPVDKLVPVYVFGQVKNPGALQVKKSNIPTLLQAIAQAGGFTDRASRSGVVIKRRDAAGKETEIRINIKDILKNKKKDVPLFENDTVYVPESLF
jgi:polysaccharide export outer membrane protein